MEVGEYVRLKSGRFFKVSKVGRKYYYLEPSLYGEGLIHFYKLEKETTYIVKHSKNIIDVIEIGDYINGHLIVNIRIDPFNSKKQLFTEHWEYNWQGDGTLLVFYEEDIKTILTKEQFKNAEYRLEK